MQLTGNYAPLCDTTFIGIGHKARNGKDTVATAIVDAFPTIVRRVGFADALYAHCYVAYGMKGKDAALLQAVGAGERERDPEIWISALYETVKRFNPQYVVIPDLRHQNEASFIKAMGGYCVKVTRLNADHSQFIDPDRDPNHISETDLDGFAGWDYWIVSDNVQTTERMALYTFRQLRDADLDRRFGGKRR
jgi:hypothetical protein